MHEIRRGPRFTVQGKTGTRQPCVSETPKENEKHER